MNRLLNFDAEVDKKDTAGNTPLMVAVLKENLVSIDILLSNKADINTINNEGKTPLIKATDINVLRQLIEAGADINIADANYLTALMLAVKSNKADFVSALLAANATFDKNSDSLMADAIGNNNIDIATVLVEVDAKVSIKNLSAVIETDDLEFLKVVLGPHANDYQLLIKLLERSVKSNKINSTHLLAANVNVDQTSAVVIASMLGYQNVLDVLLMYSKNPTFTKLVNTLTINNNMGDAHLTLSDLVQSEVGGEIIYVTNDKKFRIAQFTFDVERELDLERVSLKDNRDGTHSVFFFNSTPLGILMKDLKINDREVQFIETQSQGISKSIFIKHIEGSTIQQWKDRQGYVEDVLGISVKIEMYDKTHEHYGRYGKEKRIIIKESDLSSIPGLCGLSGIFVQDKNNHGVEEIHFSGVRDESEWVDNKDKISELLGKNVEVRVLNDKGSDDLFKVILRVSIEYSIPELLEWNDSKDIPKLLHTKRENGRNSYFYSYSHSKDLNAWLDATRRVNFKILFDQPDKVYELKQYGRTSKSLWEKYSEEFEERQMVVLHEYDSIPSKNDLMEFNPADAMKPGKVLWGYGSGASSYYSDINKMTHMMIIGGTGSGKSNFINGVVLSLLSNLDDVQKMYLIDLKAGIEFNRYKDINKNKVDVFSKGTTPTKLLSALKEAEAEMCLREKYMAEHELVQYPKDPIFIIIDEYAQIELMPGKGAEMLAQDDILALLVRIGTRSRSANIKLIVQTQNPRAVQEDLKSNLMSRALLKTSKANDMPLTLKNEDLAYEMGFNHVDFDQGRYIFEDYNDGDDKMTELQFPYIDASKKYHEKYKGTATTEVDDKFDKYKQEVVDDYPYLAETKLLSGVEPVEAEDDKKPAPEMPVSAPQTFDFNSYLSKDDSVDESSDEEDNDMEREEAEINAMNDEAMQILNEIIGDE